MIFLLVGEVPSSPLLLQLNTDSIGMVTRHDMARHGPTWHDMAWHGMAWHGGILFDDGVMLSSHHTHLNFNTNQLHSPRQVWN